MRQLSDPWRWGLFCAPRKSKGPGPRLEMDPDTFLPELFQAPRGRVTGATFNEQPPVP